MAVKVNWVQSEPFYILRTRGLMKYAINYHSAIVG